MVIKQIRPYKMTRQEKVKANDNQVKNNKICWKTQQMVLIV